MKRTLFATPQDAETAFYEAFESADLEAMMAVWAGEDEIVCVHPQGQRLQGYAAVRESWRQLFEAGGTLRFRLSDVREFHGAVFAVHMVHEHLATPDRSGWGPPVIATNVYTLTDQGWRMLLHHASVSPDQATMADFPEDVPHILH